MRFAHARYSDDPLDVEDDHVDKAASRYVCWANVRLGALDGALRDDDRTRAGLRLWSAYFKCLDYDGAGLEEPLRRRLAVQRASAWSDVRQFVAPEITEHEARRALLNGIDGLVADPTV